MILLILHDSLGRIKSAGVSGDAKNPVSLVPGADEKLAAVTVPVEGEFSRLDEIEQDEGRVTGHLLSVMAHRRVEERNGGYVLVEVRD
jgi:hypothetical protein